MELRILYERVVKLKEAARNHMQPYQNASKEQN
jgi:hypothetical protein